MKKVKREELQYLIIFLLDERAFGIFHETMNMRIDKILLKCCREIYEG
jgi:hypothetical protein